MNKFIQNKCIRNASLHPNWKDIRNADMNKSGAIALNEKVREMKPNWSIIISVLAALSPILLAIFRGIGWLYRHKKERREAVERQLSEHKYKAYITLLDIFFDVMKATKAGKTIDQVNLIDRMFNANKDLILYRSDKVVNTYQK